MSRTSPPSTELSDSVPAPSLRPISVLFLAPEDLGNAPKFDGSSPVLHDLNLDQTFETIKAGREEYDLDSFFLIPPRGVDTVRYRQEVGRDLERQELRTAVEEFVGEIRSVRKHLDQGRKLSYRYQQASWFLDAAHQYGEAVTRVARQLTAVGPDSRGMRAFLEHLSIYTASTRFRSLVDEAHQLKSALAQVTYSLLVKGRRVTVREYSETPDYSAQVLSTFQQFQRGASKDYRVKFDSFASMNHVEAEILELVANLFPDLFRQLREFPGRHGDFLDPTIRRFEREVQFYLAYREFATTLRAAGLPFCFPEVTDTSWEVFARATFDLALAHKLSQSHSAVVVNEFHLQGPERIFVVSGPNQGGKTTFARTVGQLHYLARLGLPVPGEDARLFLCDEIYTHFEKEEHLETLRGKLQDELVRLHEILARVTERSLVVVNESFTTTTLSDALFLGREVLNRVIQARALCVYVTFIDELSTLGPATVSMVSTVAPDDPTRRTFKVVRQPADGKAYALAIARKYGLTYDDLRGRGSQ